MKKRKNSGLLLAARMAAGRAARRIGARVAVAGKRVARKYGKRIATYGVNELESRGRKLLETASGSARQRIARMNPEISGSVISKAEVGEILRSIYRKHYSDKKLKNKFHRGDKVRFGGDVYRVFDYDLAGNEVLFAIYSESGRVYQFVPAAALTLVSRFSPNKKALAYYGTRTNSARMNSSKDAGKENLYHIVARNDKTGVDDYLTATPMTHRECMTMKSKLRPDSERHSHIRTLLVESTRKTDSYAKAGIGPAPSRKNPCADVSWPPHEPYQRVSRVPVYIPRSNSRRNPNFPIKAIYDGGGGVGLIPVSIIGLHPKRRSDEEDLYDVVSTSKTSKVYPKGYKFTATRTWLVAPDAIRHRKYGSYIVAHKHVLDE